MGTLYAIYEQHVFPRALDFVLRRLGEVRREALAETRGEVLELGFGTGLNLPHYPPAVRRLTTVDPMDALPRRVRARIDAAPFPVEVHHLRADGELPFDAGRFDCAALTWTLCSIPDPPAALREVHRVLRPRGTLYFLEHTRSEDPRVARWQDCWNPLQRFFACGCNVNRDMGAIIRASGFTLAKCRRFRLDRYPRIMAENIQGTGVRA
ncbi:MAG TPA: class I SAM-dependent methyltransferase [Myxococcota bacterium]|nr:class I SAM-dependent methyltransferase [Myxococcota bacterium]